MKRSLDKGVILREIIGRKYTAQILFVLYSKPLRFNKIKQLIPVITAKTLTEELNRMQDLHLVTRSTDQIPTYSVNQKAKDIADLLNKIAIIAENI